MQKSKIELGFHDSNNRLMVLQNLLENAIGMHSDDTCIARAKALVDAVQILEAVNYDVMEAVVNALHDCQNGSLFVFDAHELAFDILADIPTGWVLGPNAPDVHISIGKILTTNRNGNGSVLPTDQSVFFNEYPHATSHSSSDDDTKEFPALAIDDAFQSELVTGDIKNQGEWHRCIAIARMLKVNRMWDGELPLHLCGNVSDMHYKAMFHNVLPQAKLINRKWYAYLNEADIPVAVPVKDDQFPALNPAIYNVEISGSVEGFRGLMTRNNEAMAVVELDDVLPDVPVNQHGCLEVVVFPRTWLVYKHLITDNALLNFTGYFDYSHERPRFICGSVSPFDDDSLTNAPLDEEKLIADYEYRIACEERESLIHPDSAHIGSWDYDDAVLAHQSADDKAAAVNTCDKCGLFTVEDGNVYCEVCASFMGMDDSVHCQTAGDWQEYTAEDAYSMEFTAEVEYRLPGHDARVEQFSRWQGENGTTYTGKYVMYLEGDDTPHILEQSDTVLVQIVEVDND